MSSIPTHHKAPEKGPDGDKKLFTVEISEYEMQCVANGIAAFYNYTNREKINMNPLQVEALHSVMQKFKHATTNGKGFYRPEIVGLNGDRIN